MPAAPRPLVVRRYEIAAGNADTEDGDTGQGEATASTSVADVLRYVGLARRSLRGPLALEIEGPGDPLASPETVLRSLSLLHEHHPDVLTGLVVDGPLLKDYAEELLAFGLRFLAVRMDAATESTARRLVERAHYRGEVLDRVEAARFVLEESAGAIRLAARLGLSPLARFTLVPTVNAREVEAVAALARDAGAVRMDVRPHHAWPGAPLARAGTPTAREMRRAQEAVSMAFVGVAPSDPMISWLTPERLQPVDRDALDALDLLESLPAARTPEEAAAVLLPPRRTQLVAVATRDGTLVDTPLTGARRLDVYAVTGEAIRHLGARALSLDPRRRHDGVGCAREFLAALVGCRALVATQLTPRAVTLLQAVGIEPVAQGGPLAEVLDRVARGTLPRAGANP